MVGSGTGAAVTPRRDTLRVDLAVAALIATLVVAQFGSSVGNGFVLDDERAIHGNRCVTTDPGLSCALGHDFWGRPGHEVGRSYRPLAVLSLALDWELGSGRAWVFHLTNLLLHLLACLAVLWFLRLLVPDRQAPAVVAAVVFAALAVHTEAVAGIVGRADLLALLFGVGALAFHLKWSRTGRPVWLLGGTVLVLAALLSHEVAIVIPAAAIACDWGTDRLRSSRGRRITGYVGLMVVALGYLALRVGVMGRLLGPPPAFVNNPAVEAAAWGRVLLALASVARSLTVMALPFSLSAEHGHAVVTVPASAADVHVLVGLALVVALLLGLLAAARRVPLVAAGCGLLLAALLLLSNGPVLLPTAFAERLLYLPSLGFAMLVGGIWSLLPVRDQRWLAAGLVAAVLVPNLVIGRSYCREWRDGIRLFSSASRVNPRSVRAQLNLGLALNRAGRHHEAIVPLRRAVEIYPRLPLAAVELAMAYDTTGDAVRARRWFEAVYRVAPTLPHVALNYARFLLRHGQRLEARQVRDRLPRSTSLDTGRSGPRRPQ